MVASRSSSPVSPDRWSGPTSPAVTATSSTRSSTSCSPTATNHPAGSTPACSRPAAALIGWALAGGPGWALVVGLGCLALGVVLPARWLWRRARTARSARQAAGVPLPPLGDDPAVARLVQAYDSLGELVRGDADPARLAAHGAVLEVATLLDGRPAGSAAEREYVTTRAAALEDLTGALRARPPATEPGQLDPTLVAQARDELDALTGGGALGRLTDLIAEARAQAPPQAEAHPRPDPT